MRKATLSDVEDCVRSRPFSKNYKAPTWTNWSKYTCDNWAQEAINDCCLECENWIRNNMKKILTIVTFLLILIICQIAQFYLVGYNTINRNFNYNLKYTEQIKFLLETISNHLEMDDPEIKKKVNSLNKDYIVSYEGTPLIELMGKYFPEDVANKRFVHQKF